MKSCFKCEIQKQYSDFYRDRSRKDGYEHICKICSKENIKLRRERYSRRSKEYCHKYYKKKIKEDITYKLNLRISCAVNECLRENRIGQRWKNALVFDFDQLKQRLECQFRPGMSWDNYGKGGWHIDHKKPKSWFRFTSIHDQAFKDCWSLANLQPRWESENLSKGNRWAG